MARIYEFRYLELCEKYEGLRRVCWASACRNGGVTPDDVRFWDCPRCEGRGWIPLPEGERLGALVRVVLTNWQMTFANVEDEGITVYLRRSPLDERDRAVGVGTTPEAALTAALYEASNTGALSCPEPDLKR